MLSMLIKRFPMYSRLLIENHNYEEICKLKNNCTCMIVFSKAEKVVLTTYQSDITLESWPEPKDGKYPKNGIPTIIYHERTKHYLFRIGDVPYLYEKKEWRCNGQKIEYKNIPRSLLSLLEKKKQSQTIYTTAPEKFM